MLLRKDDPWPDDLPVPDVRDWRVVDESGDTVGFVQSLVVDTSARQLEAVLTGANDRYRAADIEIEERAVRVKKTLKRREPAAKERPRGDFEGFAEAFRDHHARTYDREAFPFERVEEAYRFGRRLSLDADYSRRPFGRAAEDIRAEYRARRLQLPYEAARGAIAFAYNLAQQTDRYDPSGMAREGRQIIADDAESPQASSRAASSMDTGAPVARDRSVLEEG